MKRIRVLVSGIVQGVGYRYFTKYKAKELGVRGFVMNLPDGRVLAVAEGNDESIEKFISALKEGPRFAVVKGLDISEEEYKGEFKDFEIRF